MEFGFITDYKIGMKAVHTFANCDCVCCCQFLSMSGDFHQLIGI